MVNTRRYAACFLLLAACRSQRATQREQPLADASPRASATVGVVPDARPEEARLGVDANVVDFASGAQTLHGFIWKPAGAGPFPAILFNHGSEELPGAKDGQAAFYLRRGFVLFVPHRRGQGRSKAAGPYIGTFYDAGAPDAPALTNQLVAQVEDVKAAAAYLAGLPYVDSKRMATVGCSFGGIEALLAAESVPGIVAAVDFAGASYTSANNPPLQERMKQAATHARVPVLFLQAENDQDTTPSRVLAQLMTASGKKNQMHIYPANGTTAEEGHHFCSGGPNPVWGDEVLAFLHSAGM